MHPVTGMLLIGLFFVLVIQGNEWESAIHTKWRRKWLNRATEQDLRKYSLVAN